VHHAVRFGRPLLARVVTVSGGAIREPKNVLTPIGARIADLVEFCGGFAARPESVVNGGPMMGQPLASLEAPVVKGTSGILALTAEEINNRPTSSCIRCGSCVTICPCGLSPVEMAAFIRKDKLEGAAKLGVMDCFPAAVAHTYAHRTSAGALLQLRQGMLKDEESEQRKSDRVKTLVEMRTIRIEKAAEAKRAALAARKPAAENTSTGETKAAPTTEEKADA